MKSFDFLELSEHDPKEFSDMGSDHWAYAALVRLKDVGIFQFMKMEVINQPKN